MKKNIYLFFMLLFLSCNGGHTPVPEPIPDPELATPNPELGPMSCQEDADCVLVKDNCCSCKSGGGFSAVHKLQQAAFEKDLEKRCSNEQFRTCVDENLCNVIYKPKCENSICITKTTSN